MEKNVQTIIDRQLGKTQRIVFLCNVSVMGAAPTIIAVDDPGAVAALVAAEGVSVSVTTIKAYYRDELPY